MKTIISLILFIGSCAVMLINSIKMFAYQIQYPDTTAMRYIVDHPDYVGKVGVALLIALISYALLFNKHK